MICFLYGSVQTDLPSLLRTDTGLERHKRSGAFDFCCSFSAIFPQTFSPFDEEQSENHAKQIVENSTCKRWKVNIIYMSMKCLFYPAMVRTVNNNNFNYFSLCDLNILTNLVMQADMTYNMYFFENLKF